MAQAGLVARVEAEADRVDQGIDGEDGVDRQRRREEHDDVDGKARPAGGLVRTLLWETSAHREPGFRHPRGTEGGRPVTAARIG